MTQLTAEECEKAIDAIVEKRNDLIRSWPQGTVAVLAMGKLAEAEADLRVLRRLQSDAASDETPQEPSKVHRLMPDWLLEHMDSNA